MNVKGYFLRDDHGMLFDRKSNRFNWLYGLRILSCQTMGNANGHEDMRCSSFTGMYRATTRRPARLETLRVSHHPPSVLCPMAAERFVGIYPNRDTPCPARPAVEEWRFSS
jgi:hypothetical protein